MNDEKSVIVTGTSSGLGLEIARTLVNSGFRVIGVSRRPTEDEGLDNSRFTHVSADLSRLEDIPGIAKKLIGIAPNPYALVNNSAIGTEGILPTMHNSEISRLIDLNLTSPILLTKYIVRPMLSQKQGRVINISSVVANTGYRGLSVYAASKAGLEGFTKSLSRDLGPRGITVNCIAPGFMETDMTSTLGSDHLQRIKRRAALGRFPTLEEVSIGVKFLLSQSASSITGTTITIDAGNSA